MTKHRHLFHYLPHTKILSPFVIRKTLAKVPQKLVKSIVPMVSAYVSTSDLLPPVIDGLCLNLCVLDLIDFSTWKNWIRFPDEELGHFLRESNCKYNKQSQDQCSRNLEIFMK
ncbi:unnamed protein product [Lactuca virosa]|uniref:Uncharacterized protein n=1 Tax=Lactuca virosa TaxID=75947 RepID=A0AAU9MHK6_9ASTR|nr:unnamed protein product [Lactuca virosa]